MKEYFAPSELIINEDGSVFHLHLKPEQLADKVILVGDPGRVATVASHFDSKECEVESREFRTITGQEDNRGLDRHRMRQYRHSDERAGRPCEHRLQDKIREG